MPSAGAPGPQASALVPVSLTATRVLVVDDNDTSRRVLGDLLQSWGASV